MSSIAVTKETQAISAATNQGLLTVTSNANLYPSTKGWVYKNDNSAHVRVLVLELIGTTQLKARIIPLGPKGEEIGPPSYGHSDLSAYNGTSKITTEAQSAPIDLAYSKRIIP